MILNRRLAANPPSVIRRIGETAASIPGCLRLTIGEPDFDAPLSVRQRIAEAIAGGDTHYPPNAGIMPLRRETAAYLNGRFGSDYLPEETLITVGSTEALGSALFAILNPGDEVICLTPCFGLYKPLIEMAGGVYRPLPRGEGITKEKLAQAVTSRSKAVLFASPNNPDGWAADEEDLAALRACALENELFLLADSVYDSLVYGGPVPSLMGDAALRDRLIYVGALSKTYAMTGVRLGYAAADAPVMREMIKAHSFLVVSAPGCIQSGCLGIFDIPFEEMRATYEKRRDRVAGRLEKMGLPVRLPRGAFYIYPSIGETGLDADTFCDRLMREGGLALIPASAFDDRGHVRISYCYAEDVLEEGMNRLERFIGILRKERR